MAPSRKSLLRDSERSKFGCSFSNPSAAQTPRGQWRPDLGVALDAVSRIVEAWRVAHSRTSRGCARLRVFTFAAIAGRHAASQVRAEWSRYYSGSCTDQVGAAPRSDARGSWASVSQLHPEAPGRDEELAHAAQRHPVLGKRADAGCPQSDYWDVSGPNAWGPTLRGFSKRLAPRPAKWAGPHRRTLLGHLVRTTAATVQIRPFYRRTSRNGGAERTARQPCVGAFYRRTLTKTKGPYGPFPTHLSLIHISEPTRPY